MLYNAACAYCALNRKAEAMDALRKAWDAGFKEPTGRGAIPTWRSSTTSPEFERLYPPKAPGG